MHPSRSRRRRAPGRRGRPLRGAPPAAPRTARRRSWSRTMPDARGPHAVLGGESQHGVDLTDRVAVDRRGIEPAQVVGAGPSGIGEQLEHAGLRERDDLHRERTVVLGDRRVYRLDPTEPDPRVDVDVGADRGGAVPHELGEHAPGDLARRDAELVTPGALVPDAALRAAFAAVPLPGKPHHDLSTCACALTRPGRASRPRPSITPPAGRSAASSSASSSIAEAGWMPVIRPSARCTSTRVDSSAAEVPRRTRRTTRGEGSVRSSLHPAVRERPKRRDSLVLGSRAYGAVGSAPRSHRGGQEFESP